MTNESELESALKFLAAEGQKCDRMDALKELLAKVEAGFFPLDISARDIGLENVDSLPLINTMFSAFRGSLDAAKALHIAVSHDTVTVSMHQDAEGILSEGPSGLWHVRLFDYVARIKIVDKNGREKVCHFEANVKDQCPARAWLIAILRALIAEEK